MAVACKMLCQRDKRGGWITQGMRTTDGLRCRACQRQGHRYASKITLTPVLKRSAKNDAKIAKMIGEQIKARRIEPRLVAAIEKFECRQDCVNGIQGALSSDGFACDRESALHPERELGFNPQ